MANKLREQNLVGLDVEGLEKLLGQYADDLDMYLWGTRENVRQAIKTIRKFEESSGMRINVAKSTIMKVGSSKNIDLGLELKEVSRINILGIEVLNFVDDDETIKINYDRVVAQAQALLNQWSTRNLSLFGKILVINTLIAPLFVYKMTVLPPIPEKYCNVLNEMFNKFLWNSNHPKIKLEILQIPKKTGRGRIS